MKFTDKALQDALKVASKYATNWMHTSLGHEYFAASASEKWFHQTKKTEKLEKGNEKDRDFRVGR